MKPELELDPEERARRRRRRLVACARRDRRAEARWIYAFAIAEALLIAWAMRCMLLRDN